MCIDCSNVKFHVPKSLGLEGDSLFINRSAVTSIGGGSNMAVSLKVYKMGLTMTWLCIIFCQVFGIHFAYISKTDVGFAFLCTSQRI